MEKQSYKKGDHIAHDKYSIPCLHSISFICNRLTINFCGPFFIALFHRQQSIQQSIPSDQTLSPFCIVCCSLSLQQTTGKVLCEAFTVKERGKEEYRLFLSPFKFSERSWSFPDSGTSHSLLLPFFPFCPSFLSHLLYNKHRLNSCLLSSVLDVEQVIRSECKELPYNIRYIYISEGEEENRDKTEGEEQRKNSSSFLSLRLPF